VISCEEKGQESVYVSREKVFCFIAALGLTKLHPVVTEAFFEGVRWQDFEDGNKPASLIKSS